MMHKILVSFFAGLILAAAYILLPPHSAAQQPAAADITLDGATRGAVISTLINDLNDSYVFPEIAKKMQADLEKRKAGDEYNAIVSSRAFAERLTQDLQAISKDKHLRVRFSFDKLPVRAERSEPTEAEKEQNKWFSRRTNFGFEKVERLGGNIGYIDLRGFSDHENGADTVAAAMSFLANTEAIIFDLRQNGGGSPDMVALISSYLFGDKPVHLNDLYWRPGNKTNSFWTKPESAAKRFPNKDIYVLTSNRTFSAAEEFSYNLKNLKRATIVGETTGGGAHPGGIVRLSDHFSAFVPTGRAINPITKSNWEGTGVEPDVKVSKEQALNVAHLAALRKSLDSIKDENVKKGVKELIDKMQKELEDMKAAK